ncbi:hypothetical protein HPB51_001053 [Rhipicephalus microplus]|uniref:Sulfotransferase domain-containing protein n=1 Tax=Rhipicephalus microplus TaxID=6941 RepID=A0A9J6DR36_RHIMP|nr:hypothetical protein HPB51_001053 [Rhipicephalus microplus]
MSPHSTKRFHRELARMDDTTALLVNKAQLTILAANAAGVSASRGPAATRSSISHHRYVYALRNPYDTCVSYYHQVQQKAPGCGDLTFDEFFEQFIDGWIHPDDYFDHLASWFAHKARPNFLCVAYEHMKKDPRSGIQKIAAFLGKEISDDAALDEIVQTVSPDVMKRAFAEALSARQQEKSVKGRPPNGALDNSSDGVSKLKGGSLVRTATVGDWKNHFLASQIDRMKAKMASKTVGFRTDLEVLWKDANLP